jgi:hypothetical protein
MGSAGRFTGLIPRLNRRALAHFAQKGTEPRHDQLAGIPAFDQGEPFSYLNFLFIKLPFNRIPDRFFLSKK